MAVRQPTDVDGAASLIIVLVLVGVYGGGWLLLKVLDHNRRRRAVSETRCKHELLPGQCADCKGLREVVPNPHEGLIIERFYQAAQHRQACVMSFNGLQRHDIEPGDRFARAVRDNDTGTPPFKPLGYVCDECAQLIAQPGTSVQ